MKRAMSNLFSDRINEFARWVAVFMLLFFMTLTGACVKGGSGKIETKPEVISGLAVETLQLRDVADANVTSGTVKARTVSVISAKFMGNVTEVRVRQGDTVRAGQLLLNIDAEDVARAMEAALSQKELADVTAVRYRKLFAENAVPRQQLDEVESRRKTADAEYARAVANLGFARITSPIDGVVTDRRIDPGSMASPGTSLLTVEDTSGFSVETQADERMVGRVVVGMPVEVHIGSIGRAIQGRVVEVSPSMDTVTHSFFVKVAMEDPALRTGFYAKVSFPLGSRKALLAPVGSIVTKGQLIGVYVVDEQGVISYRLVKTGKTVDGQVEILSGLSVGDRIVIKGVEKAKDGAVMSKVIAP
ncbi:MAG: efflux transporter, family, subunit [Firmicutes bacterium]|nr:efflux transporter, family, subunit [Bacillota bacterium]